MTTILFTFLLALLLGFALTPLAEWAGIRLGAVDRPGERKVHDLIIPRTGGLAIVVAFLGTLVVVWFLMTDVSRLLIPDRQKLFLLAGGAVVFCVGLVDDFRRLGPKTKLLFQILAASLAWWGGVTIKGVSLFGLSLYGEFWSYGLTVLWFVIFINAINLVDGLDGLAGGITAFGCAVMIVLALFKGDLLTALLFSALGGAVLGFLRYNFNPASIFLGDGGSYFLGYSMAGISMLTSIKGQMSAAMLIPLVALGVPVLDTILSPIRRFLRGKKAFSPDHGHIHHRLKDMGFTTRKAVFVLYGITLALCIAALVMVNIRDERAGLLLFVLGVGAVIFVRKLGYFEYFGYDKIFGWLKDLTDEAGFSRERRSFLGQQMDITRSISLDELWGRVHNSCQSLGLDYVEMRLKEEHFRCPEGEGLTCYFRSGELDSTVLDWNRDLYILLPLNHEGTQYGSMAVAKDLSRSPLDPFTLRRIEHLRRTVVDQLGRLSKNAQGR